MTSRSNEKIFIPSLQIYSNKPNDKHGNKGRNQTPITFCIKKVRICGFLSQRMSYQAASNGTLPLYH